MKLVMNGANSRREQKVNKIGRKMSVFCASERGTSVNNTGTLVSTHLLCKVAISVMEMSIKAHRQ